MSQAVAAADSVLARLAERVLTVVGVPILLAALGFLGTQVWSVRDRLAAHDGELALRRAELAVIERRNRDEVEASRVALREATEREAQARVAGERVRDERDAAHERQIGEIAGAVAAARAGMARFGAQLAGARSDLAEIKGLLQRPLPAVAPTAAPARAIDHLPPGGWTGGR